MWTKQCTSLLAPTITREEKVRADREKSWEPVVKQGWVPSGLDWSGTDSRDGKK